MRESSLPKLPKVQVAHRGVADGGKPVATELIAESIVEISRGMKALRLGALNDKALILLVSEHSRVGRREVQMVLDSLESLEAVYTRKKP